MQPAAVQHLHGGLEAAALDTAQQGRGRHAAIGEDDIGDLGPLLAHLAIGGADGDAGQARLDQEGRDPSSARLGRLGPGHDGEEAGPGRVGDEALRTVQQIALALAPCAGLEARGIRAALRLGQAEGADDLARGQARQIAAASGPRCRRSGCRASRCRYWCRRASGRPARSRPSSKAICISSTRPSPSPPILRRGGEAEQPQPPHLIDDALGNRIGLGDRALLRHQPLPHEAAHRLHELIAAQAVERHPAAFIRRLPGFAARRAAGFPAGPGRVVRRYSRGPGSRILRNVVSHCENDAAAACALPSLGRPKGRCRRACRRASPAPPARPAIGGSGSRSYKR